MAASLQDVMATAATHIDSNYLNEGWKEDSPSYEWLGFDELVLTTNGQFTMSGGF